MYVQKAVLSPGTEQRSCLLLVTAEIGGDAPSLKTVCCGGCLNGKVTGEAEVSLSHVKKAA